MRFFHLRVRGMALAIDLGRGVFRILDANLTLILNASAEILLDCATTGASDPESLRKLLQNRQIWVTQAPELKLHICLDVEPNLAHPASTFFLQAGDLLRNSKVFLQYIKSCHYLLIEWDQIWSDLGLGVLFRSYNYNYEASDPRRIHLYFGLRKLASRSAHPKIFRVPGTLQNPPEAIPPVGIPTASLSSVTITLEYMSTDETIEYMSQQLYTIPTTGWDDSEQSHYLITPPSSQNQYLPPESSQEACLNKDAGPDIKEDVQETNEAWVPFHCFHSFKGSPQCKEDFNKLLDISIRSLITSKPTCIDETIQQEKDEHLTHLCRLAPTVFSMGYSEVCLICTPPDSLQLLTCNQAMNQRSQFIPSIAKSLESIIRRSRNPDLHEKISALKSSPSQSDVPPKEVPLRTAIKSSLWRIAQNQLHNPNASRDLSALDSTITTKEEPPMDDISNIDDADDDHANEDDYLLTDEEEELIFSDNEAGNSEYPHHTHPPKPALTNTCFTDNYPGSDDIIDFKSSPPPQHQHQHPFGNHQNNRFSPIGYDNEPCPKDELISSPCLLATSSFLPDKSLFQNAGSDSEMLTDPLDHDIPIQDAHDTTTINQEDYISDDIRDMIWD